MYHDEGEDVCAFEEKKNIEKRQMGSMPRLSLTSTIDRFTFNSVQVNIPAESGIMGVLANHVPSIEQLKPGLVEIIEENGGSKRFFRTFCYVSPITYSARNAARYPRRLLGIG